MPARASVRHCGALGAGGAPEEEPSPPPPGARAPWRPRAGLLGLALSAAAGYGLLAAAPDAAAVRTLSLTFSSIVLEAIPFMLLGSMAGGLIEAFVSRGRMVSLLPRRGWVTIMAAGGMGMLFPVCECAVVPVVRRLAGKGLPAPAAVAYLLGGPIVNPIVAASTALAYKFDWRVVGLRTLLGYATAVAVSFALERLFRRGGILRADILHAAHAHAHPEDAARGCGHAHADHGHVHAEDAARGCGHAHADAAFGRKMACALRHASDDFLGVAHFLVIGAFIAALAQTFIDRSLFLAFAESPVLPTLLMMALAILLNLCSESDAFIAASFRGLMPPSAQMAFMLTGPMFDLKLLLMYQTVFRPRAIAVLAGLILMAVLAASLALEALGGMRP